jgi:hypothetical protein
MLFGLAQAQSITTYHAAADRSGHYIMPALTWETASGLHVDPKFAGTVVGDIYAQPLFWKDAQNNRRLIVATESNNVYALNATNGKVVWETSLGTPVPLTSLTCGNISPLGITGTPVIDATQAAVYLDAMIQDTTGPQHYIYGLSLADGSILSGLPVNVADALTAAGYSFDPTFQIQRGALLIVNNTLFIPYGADYGDCGSYHGWVLGMNLGAPATLAVWRTIATGGGIWAPGGISYDGTSLLAATGNTFSPSTWSDGEAVFRFNTTLSVQSSKKDYFAAANWSHLDAGDLDLGSSGAVPISVVDASGTSRYVLALGKDGNAYLLNRGNLGGIGGPALVQAVSSGFVMTAPAIWAGTDSTLVAFQGAGINCPAGQSGDLTTLMVQAHPASISTAWCASANGGGAPIVTTLMDGSNPIVWITGAEGDNLLHGFRGDTGAPLFSGGAMVGLRHFGTILAANGRLYVAADGRIYSFLP